MFVLFKLKYELIILYDNISCSDFRYVENRQAF